MNHYLQKVAICIAVLHQKCAKINIYYSPQPSIIVNPANPSQPRPYTNTYNTSHHIKMIIIAKDTISVALQMRKYQITT